MRYSVKDDFYCHSIPIFRLYIYIYIYSSIPTGHLVARCCHLATVATLTSLGNNDDAGALKPPLNYFEVHNPNVIAILASSSPPALVQSSPALPSSVCVKNVLVAWDELTRMVSNRKTFDLGEARRWPADI